jgi:lipoate-protein ligase A
MGRQLALSEALLAELAATGQPALRWYVPAAPALVLGNGQKPALANLAACQERGIQVYRRTSGGAAVLVNADLLSLDAVLPDTHPLATTDVVRAYQWMGELWEEALHTLGVAKARALPTEEVRALTPLAADDPLRLACYGTLSPWEVAVGKRKLVGLCQVRRRAGTLYAGTLYQVGIHPRFDPRALGELLDLNNNRRKTLAARLHNAAVGLDQAAGRAIGADEVMRAVEPALAGRYGARLVPSDYTPAERAAADRIQRERFQSLA